MDSRDLLALLLDTDPKALLIPAHIWTPWFSALGAKSGFEGIAECYGDMTPFITAVETGLSSNPPMNWALRSLDPFSIISNSDAHGPEKLGREGTVFAMDMSLPSLTAALRRVQGCGILETIEFFPQEGKYHYDGHRKCAVYLNPEDAAALSGRCPVCHKPLTRGVMGRVLELADEPVDEWAPCPENYVHTNRRPYRSLIPLKELLGELLTVGSASKKVDRAYRGLIEAGGSELSLLMDTPLATLERLGMPGLSGEQLAEAIRRMRQGVVSIQPGYDGEYGIIRVFPQRGDDAAQELPGMPSIPSRPSREEVSREKKEERSAWEPQASQEKAEGDALPPGFVPQGEQEEVLAYKGRYALIIAGPGSGKTATLAARIARLVREGTPGEAILAVTFTVKAAWELRERVGRTLEADVPGGILGLSAGNAPGITAHTFHSLCASLLRKHREGRGMALFTILSETERERHLQDLCAELPGRLRPQGLGVYIETRKRFLLRPGETRPRFLEGARLFDDRALGLPPAQAALEEGYLRYQERLRREDRLDFEDLVLQTLELLVQDSGAAAFRYIFVDEYQDINLAQYVLIRLLAQNKAALWVIGDPNQGIYGFRGSDTRFIDRFRLDYPEAAGFHLAQSFRCAEPISAAAGTLMRTPLKGTAKAARLLHGVYPTEKSEAQGIARRIGQLIGGTTFFALDSAAAEGGVGELRGLRDCAILLRTMSLAGPITKALGDHGIPWVQNGEKPWWEAEPIPSLLGMLGNATAVSPKEAVQRAWEAFSAKGKVKPAYRDLAERLICAAQWYATLPDFLDTLAVRDPAGEGDGMEPGREGVQIMSIHASKGLEFDQVFVPALEDGFLPFTLYGKQDREEKIAEEKRLLYVAMTRARTGLYLSSARKRTFQGRVFENPPSPFLEALESLVPRYEASLRRPRPATPQLPLF
jgi:uncharacterized protein (TIGR00375 family)